MKHELYTDADSIRPSVLNDRNGEVVLRQCKMCGRAEAELGENDCPGTYKDTDRSYHDIIMGPRPTDNVPHVIHLEPSQVDKDWAMLEARFTEATQLKPDTTLRTKDGSKMGNAIAVRWVENGARMEIETDFGNRVILSEAGILEQFRLGFHQPYAEWFDARLEKIQANAERENMA
jgi:hypothetical protein